MNINFSNKKLIEFNVLISLLLVILFNLILPVSKVIIINLLILFFFLLCLIKPKLLLNPFKFWMSFGLILSKVNSYLILGFIYIFILLPIAFIMRIFDHDPLKKKFSKNNSYKEYSEEYNTDLTQIF